MYSYKNLRIFLRVISFAVLCAYFGYAFTLIEKGLLGDLEAYPVTGNPYRFENAVKITTISSFGLGIFLGLVEVFFFDKLFRKVSFLVKLLSKTFLYIFFISLFFNIVTLLNSSYNQGLSIFHPEIIETSRLFFTNSLFVAVLLYAGGIIALLLFLFEIYDNLGQGVVINFIMGKYHKPRYEDRIFMFLDLKSSVTLAEKLGNTTYFEFLKDYYADMTSAIEKSLGKIYQYVGDEIVIFWKPSKGLKKSNCVACFFRIKDTFDRLAATYESKFGVVPMFKGALHMGKVATGEIGVLKKEIFYSGDVLNTTSRIESLCNAVNEECIISEDLHRNLHSDAKYEYRLIDDHVLRGKSQKIALYGVSRLD
jgi:adenylate cyclase